MLCEPHWAFHVLCRAGVASVRRVAGNRERRAGSRRTPLFHFRRQVISRPVSNSALLTKMTQSAILRVRDLLAAPAAPGAPLSRTLSLPRHVAAPKIALTTGDPTCSYKKPPAPMAQRASVNFSLVDSRAEEDWLLGRGSLRDGKERYRTRAHRYCAFRSPQVVVSEGTDWPANGL